MRYSVTSLGALGSSVKRYLQGFSLSDRKLSIVTSLPANERILTVMYQYSRAIYRSVKDLIDPYVDVETRLEYRRAVLDACEETVERLARDPRYFARPDRTLFNDIRRYFPITAQAQVCWAVTKGIGAAVEYIESQIESGAFDGGAARCQATTRKGKPCQRTPLPDRDYCPSHQHLEARRPAASAQAAA